MAAIDITGLVKRYGGNVHALKGVNLKVEQGEIYGLLGRNGAGKTTLVKILLGIVRPTDGDVKLLGLSPGDPKSRTRVGYLPEDHRFPEYHTGETALDFYGSLSGMTAAQRRERIPQLLQSVGIADAGKRKVRTYSKGMKQRLGLAQAMLHDPDVLFLDEPTDGVDAVGRKEIRDLLEHLKKRGKTIFLNSHLLSEVERLCDRVGIIELGAMKLEDSVANLTKVGNIYTLTFEKSPEELIPLLQPPVTKGVTRSGVHALDVTVEDVPKLNTTIDAIRQKGWNLVGIVAKTQSLEQVFMQTLDKPAEGGAA